MIEITEIRHGFTPELRNHNMSYTVITFYKLLYRSVPVPRNKFCINYLILYMYISTVL